MCNRSGREAWAYCPRNCEREREKTHRRRRELGQFSCQESAPAGWRNLTGAGIWKYSIDHELGLETRTARHLDAARASRFPDNARSSPHVRAARSFWSIVPADWCVFGAHAEETLTWSAPGAGEDRSAEDLTQGFGTPETQHRSRHFSTHDSREGATVAPGI